MLAVGEVVFTAPRQEAGGHVPRYIGRGMMMYQAYGPWVMTCPGGVLVMTLSVYSSGAFLGSCVIYR